MRVLLWNCCNGLGRKEQIEQFKSFAPDLAIIPEIKEKNIAGLTPSDSVWKTNNFSNPSPKGLGVLSFNGIGLKALTADEDMEIFLPLRVETGRATFNLLAVWNFYSACKQGRFRGVEGEKCLEWEALRHYKTLMSDGFLMVGDFNFGPTFSEPAFLHMCRTLQMSSVISLYHQFFALPESCSEHATFKTPNGIFHHLDHFFGSPQFVSNMQRFSVTPFDQVILSDHAPVLVEFSEL